MAEAVLRAWITGLTDDKIGHLVGDFEALWLSQRSWRALVKEARAALNRVAELEGET